MCRMYVLHTCVSVYEEMDLFGPRVDVVLDCRLFIGGSMSPSFDDLAYRVVSV